MSDLIIIGGGIAGITAAIYAKRSGLDFILLEDKIAAGQINYIDRIDNYPGVKPGISGAEFSAQLTDQLSDLEITIENEKVESIEKDSGNFNIQTSGKKLSAKTIIIATGAYPQNLGLEQENEFKGKGVSYCAVCDGFFYRNKTIAVVGGGNSACEEALYLSNIAKKVYLIHRRDKLRAFDYLANLVINKNNIEMLWNSIISDLKGNQTLEKIVVTNTLTQKETSIDAQGLFVAIGYKPNTEIFKNIINLDDNGFIITDQKMKTSTKGIFACGDCIKKDLRQLITSAAEGALAAISAYSYLNKV